MISFINEAMNMIHVQCINWYDDDDNDDNNNTNKTHTSILQAVMYTKRMHVLRPTTWLTAKK